MIPFLTKNRTPLDTSMVKKFIDTYARQDNWHEIDKTSGSLGYGWIHYSLIRILRPDRVLCIGSRYGFIPAICAMACKDNKKGIVDFVDAGFDQANPLHNSTLGAKKNTHWGGVGFWNNVNIRKYFGVFGLENYIKFYKETSREFAAHSKKSRWGYVYLDGDHSYRGITLDFTLFWPRIPKGGMMSIHDIYTDRLGDLSYGVKQFWRRVAIKQHGHIEMGRLFGLGILQK